MSQMDTNLDIKGFRSIAQNYDLFFIDLWGVIHNGISLFQDSVNVLNELQKLDKDYVLLTNAPRPTSNVKKFLEKMGLEKIKRDKVYTSGEAALNYLNTNLKSKKFFHLGPTRDIDLFKLFENNKVGNINNADFILCTGLLEDHEEDIKFYKSFFKNLTNKRMICTNPDLIVDRGETREYCAGSVAKVFEESGGAVDYFGKPYPLVYSLSADIKNKKILCVGDNLNTDIKGANMQNFNSLLILNGIHKEEIKNINLTNLFNKYDAKANYTQSNFKW